MTSPRSGHTRGRPLFDIGTILRATAGRLEAYRRIEFIDLAE
jgi:hypothetical protein